MNLTQHEQNYVTLEVNKRNKRLLRQLTKVNNTGLIGKDAGETLLLSGMIRVCGPRPGINNYNCFTLTTLGKDTLNKLLT